MNEQSSPSAGTAAGTGAAPAAGTAATGSTKTASKGATAAKAAVGPLTLRDLIVLGSVAIIFVASVVPIVKTIVGNANLWTTAGLFFIGIGVILPLIVGGLFLARRMNPAAKVRIGSLSVDQFSSVVASFATFFFFSATVSNFSIAYLIGLIGSLFLLVSTVCAQWIPVFAADFSGRTDVPAHVAARDAVPAVKRPAAPKPVATQPGAGQQGPGQPGAGQQFGQQQFGQGAPSHGGPTQYVPGQQGAGAQQSAQQGGWNAAPAATHTSAGQIFTPAKENSAGAGAGAAAAGAVAAANPAASAAATSGAATSAAATSGHSSTQNPATDRSAPAANTAAQTSVDAPALAHGENGPSKDAAATTLNPQVPEAAKPEAAKPETAVESPVAPAAARESITATVNPVTKPVVAEPFWFAVDRPQNVIDEKTRQFAFKLAPGAWILALEDRGNSFLVQDSHGKTGLLLDLVGIERASDSQ